jgi:hypothetical protein
VSGDPVLRALCGACQCSAVGLSESEDGTEARREGTISVSLQENSSDPRPRDVWWARLQVQSGEIEEWTGVEGVERAEGRQAAGPTGSRLCQP